MLHCHSVTIKGLPKGAKYSIIEQPVSGYTATNTVTDENGTKEPQAGHTASGVLNAPNSVAYGNDTPYSPALGTRMTGMLPFAGMTILFLGAAVLRVLKMRNGAKQAAVYQLFWGLSQNAREKITQWRLQSRSVALLL